MARAHRQKINGVIDKRHLAEIFRRAESVCAGSPGGGEKRQPGRLGKELIQELLRRAVMISDRPAIARAPRVPKPDRPEPQTALVQESPAPESPTPKAEATREFLHRVDDLAARTPAEPGAGASAASQAEAKATSSPRGLDGLEEEDGDSVVYGADTEVLEAIPEVPSNVVEPVSEPAATPDSGASEAPIDGWASEAPEPLASDTDAFLSLTELTESLSRATKGHLDDQAAMRTMIEDLELPDADDAETQRVLERVAQAEEISFEGYLEDIEELLLETYEHYRSLPRALDARPVDPATPDLLGPAGETLETRRADRKASQTLSVQPPSAVTLPSASRGHLVPREPVRAPLAPVVPLRPGAQAPRSGQPDPFAVDPYSGVESPSVFAPPSGAKTDPFSLDPYTGRPIADRDPFALDPFNPFGGPSANPPGYAPASELPPPPPGSNPFLDPHGSPLSAPLKPPTWGAASALAPGCAPPPPPQPLPDAPLPPPGGHLVSPPPLSGAGEGFDFDPFADPNESQDPYSWPSRPPKALADAQARADEVAAQFDPFGPSASAAPGVGAAALSAENPFGLGDMFGKASAGAAPAEASRPPGAPIGFNSPSGPSEPFGALGADDTKRAFENALVVAGLRGMLEYQRPTPGHGSSHPLLVIYDASTGLFKAPLTPRLSVGDRFQLKDGRIYRVDGCRVFEVGGVACYQEAECKPLGQLNMSLRDSWDEPNPPR